MPDGDATVRILAGPQSSRFATDALDSLQSAPYRVDAESNRMGFRLTGPALTHSDSDFAEMLSEVATLGALQVPAGGQPLLLMADRPTSGGYPSIATVITADIPVVGQLAPGDSISFAVTTRREAMAALIAQEQRLMALESSRLRR
jgi:antagonist of KipI